MPTGLNWNEHRAGSAITVDRRLRQRLLQRRVGVVGEALEDREVGQRGEQAAGHDDRLAADLVGQPAEQDEERRADQRATPAISMLAVAPVDLQRLGQEEQRVELARCTRPRPGRRSAPNSARIAILALRPVAERFGQRRLRALALGLHLLEHRRFVRAAAGSRPRPPSRTIETRNGMRQPQSPKASSPMPGAHAEDDEQRQEQAERGRGLDPRGVGAALAAGAHARPRRWPRRRIRRRAPGPAAGAARSG